MPHISTEELIRDREKLIVVEALSRSSYAKGHIPGAKSLPRSKVNALAPTLVPDKSAAIVTYCKGPT